MLDRLPASTGEMKTKLTQSQLKKEMDCGGVSGVVHFLSFKAGGTKCDASVGRSVGCSGYGSARWRWDTGALGLVWAWPAGWLAGCPGRIGAAGPGIRGDFSCRLAQQRRRRSVESESESGSEVEDQIETVLRIRNSSGSLSRKRREYWVS